MHQKRGIKLFTSKKGMDIELWFNVFELVIVFLVGFILLDTVNSEVRATTYDKIYFSRDNALLLNTIYAAQGDIKYYYPEKTSNLIFDFKQNRIDVYEQHEIKEGAISYPFAEDRTYTLSYTKLLPKNLEENRIFYSEDKNTIKIT